MNVLDSVLFIVTCKAEDIYTQGNAYHRQTVPHDCVAHIKSWKRFMLVKFLGLRKHVTGIRA